MGNNKYMQTRIRNYILRNHILVAVIFIAAGWFLIQIREILVLVFLSYILMAGLAPYVHFLRRRRVPKVLATSIIYLVTFLLILVLIVPIIPFMISQFENFAVNFPSYFNGIIKLLRVQSQAQQIQAYIAAQIGNLGPSAVTITGQVLVVIFSLILVFILSFYLMIDQDRVRRELLSFFPKALRDHAGIMLDEVEDNLGAWLRGQILLAILVGVLTWIALSIIGFPFALPLALFAGIFQVVPIIGPILAAIPAIIVALSFSPGLMIAVIVAYLIIQTVVNNFVVPKAMQKAVGLNPIVIIVVLGIGAALMGIWGILLSIPFASMIATMYKSFRKED